MPQRITKADIKALLREPGRPKIYDTQKGLLLRKKGEAAIWTYRLQMGGKDKWLDLGNAGELEPDNARKIAAEIAHDLGRGVQVDESYVVEKRQQFGLDLSAPIVIPSFRPTFGGAQVDYLRYLKENRALATYNDYRKAFNADGIKALAQKPVDRVTREELARIVDAISLEGKQRSAVKLCAILSGMWTYLSHDSQIGKYGVDRGMLIRFKPLEREGASNPTIEPTAAEVRDMLNRRGELTRQTADAITLLTYTGQRRATVTKARREHFRYETDEVTKRLYLVWRMPKIDMKAKRQHVIPVPKLLWPIIENVDKGWIFKSDIYDDRPIAPGTLTQALSRDLEVSFRPHGMRTALTTAIRKAGFPETAPPKILHHAEGSTGNVTKKFYDFFEDLHDKAEMLDAWVAAIGETKVIDRYVDRQGRPGRDDGTGERRQRTSTLRSQATSVD